MILHGCYTLPLKPCLYHSNLCLCHAPCSKFRTEKLVTDARLSWKENLSQGIKHIDFLHPLAAGLRYGIFGPRQSGKVDLILDIICNQAHMHI
jgi:F0F1-type ATP synthase alpha subunit